MFGMKKKVKKGKKSVWGERDMGKKLLGRYDMWGK